jgi:transposase
MAKLSAEVKAERLRRKRRMAPRLADWVAIRALYLGGMKSPEIAEKFGISANHIRARAHDEKWFENALDQTPRLVIDKIMRQEAEATGAMLTEIWSERGKLIREKEFRIAEKVSSHAETMDDAALLNKIEKVKVAIDMGRRSTGLDKAEANANAVNIAVLGDIGMFDNEAAVFKRAPKE